MTHPEPDPERWARLRFAIIGPLLAAPPDSGELRAQLQALAQKSWRHPIKGTPVQFGFATLERWYYQARSAADPVAALRRRRRHDAGRSRLLSALHHQAIEAQYRAHPGWTVQLRPGGSVLDFAPPARPSLTEAQLAGIAPARQLPLALEPYAGQFALAQAGVLMTMAGLALYNVTF